MTVREIITPNNPVLRRKARKVTAFTPALQELIDDMIETMHESQGVGLAAPQVAEGVRLFVAHLEEDPKAEEEYPDLSPAPGIGRVHVVINPDIIRTSRKQVTGTEGCLSIPGYAGDVERPWEVTIRYLDRQGQQRKLRTFGWMARVLQHEYDHLEGVLFIDRTDNVWKVEEEEEETDESTATEQSTPSDVIAAD